MIATWLLLVAALSLVAASVVYADAVALASVRSTVAGSAPSDRSIVIRLPAAAADAERLDRIVFDLLATALHTTGGSVGLVARTDALVPQGLPANDVDNQIALAAFEGIERHATVVSGAWPVSGATPRQAVVSEGAARALNVAIGSSVVLASRANQAATVGVVISGVYRPDRGDPYWLGNELDLAGIERTGAFTARGPVVVTRADLVADARAQLHLEWRALPDASHLRVDDLEPLREATDQVAGNLHAALPTVSGATVSSTLPAAFAELERAVTVSRTGVILLVIQFVALAAYAVLLLASVLVERRRSEVALLQSRGATPENLTMLALFEGVGLAVPAIPVALMIAIGAVGLLGAVPPLSATDLALDPAIGLDAVVAVVLAAAIAIAALVLPTMSAGSRISAVRAALARPVARTFAHRVGLDLVLVVLAGLGLWQLRTYGAPLTTSVRGSLGLDPLLVAAPAIGLLAGGVIAARIVPRLAEGGERALRARRGLVATLGAREVARRPLRYTRSALLLVLAAALATFAATYAATWTQSQADQAGYAAAADIRAIDTTARTLPDWARGTAYRSIPGVTAVAPVVHEGIGLDGSDRETQLLAISSRVATAVDERVGGDVVSALALLGPEPAAGDTLPLPAGTARIAVSLETNLSPSDSVPSRPGTVGRVGVSLIVDGPDGLARITGPAVDANSGAQRVEIPLAVRVAGTTTAPGPLRLAAVELSVTPPGNGADLTGELSISNLDVAAGGAAWTPFPLPTGHAGWGWDRAEGGVLKGITTATGTPATLTFSRGGPAGGPIPGGNPGDSAVVLRLRVEAAVPDRLAAIVSAGVARARGTTVGGDLTALIAGRPVPLRVVGVRDQFAPLDPASPFAIVDARALEWFRFGRMGDVAAAQEWWFTVPDGASAVVSGALLAPPFSVRVVVGRVAELHSRSQDVVALAAIGALLLGGVAALLIAAIGFVVSAAASTTERQGEFALLRALGLSARSLGTWLAFENAFLLAFGVVAGAALGVVLGWLVVPFASMNRTGSAVVPAPDLVVPWQVVAVLLVLAAVLLAASTVAARRQVPGLAVGRLLRAGDA